MTCSLTAVNEGTTIELTATFKDFDDLPAVPATVTYRIDCLTSGTVVKADTPVTPASSVVLTIGASDNAIQDDTNASERKQVTVKATYGGSDGVNDTYTYSVSNLAGVS